MVSDFCSSGTPVASAEHGRKKACVNMLLWSECAARKDGCSMDRLIVRYAWDVQVAILSKQYETESLKSGLQIGMW